jgi:hypothetical protein
MTSFIRKLKNKSGATAAQIEHKRGLSALPEKNSSYEQELLIMRWIDEMQVFLYYSRGNGSIFSKTLSDILVVSALSA